MRSRCLVLTLLLSGIQARAIDGASSQLGHCWQQWNEFWTANNSVSYSSTLLLAPPTTTTYLTAKTAFSTYHTEYTTTSTYTRVEYLGPAGVPNAQALTVTSTMVETYNGPTSTVISVGPSHSVTETHVNTANYLSIATMNANASAPSCTLPAQYPPCQSQWDAWASADIRADENQQPLCTQATVEGPKCQRVISNYYSGIATLGFTGIPGWVTSGTSTFWPTTRGFAPGCTLGCQRCAIMGDKVRILYWPASTATAVENGTATASLVLQSGLSSGVPDMRTTVFEGITLTSPTIYISYKTLYASDSCSGVGRTVSNTIIPLTNSQDLHSLAYTALDDFGPGPGLSGVQYLRWEYEEQPFNFTDLEEPIPDAIYNKLPYCQMAYRGFAQNGLQDSMAFSCTREGPYNPVIAVPPEVRNLDPAWQTCTGWYAGLYDPPRALQGAPSAAKPTAPVEPTSASAEPIATMTNDAPRHTEHSGTRQTSGISYTSQDDPSVTGVPSEPENSGVTDIGGIILSAINGGGIEEALSSLSVTRDNEESSQNELTRPTTTAGASVGDDVSSSNLPTLDQLSTTNVGSARSSSVQTGPTSTDPVANGATGPSSTDRDHYSTSTSARLTTSATVLYGGGEPHTLHIESGQPVIDGTTLTQGEMTMLGGRVLSISASKVYIDGSRWVPHASTAIRTSKQSGVVFTLSDEVLDPEVYTAYTIPGHPKEIVADGLTMTQGAPAKAFDLFLLSLGTDGVLYTVPIPHTTYTSSVSTTASAAGDLPTSARFWTATSSPVSSSLTSGASQISRQSVWAALLLSLVLSYFN